MKCDKGPGQHIRFCVAPLVGAWIEILNAVPTYLNTPVAPLVGAWIEIVAETEGIVSTESLPLWERGLKSPDPLIFQILIRRSPRGSVN